MSRYDEGLFAPKTLTQDQAKALQKTTGERAAGWRDHVLIAVALATGLREHEIVGLNVGDVFDRDGRARRTVDLRVFKRVHQDAALQQVALSEKLRAKLERLRVWKEQRGERLDPDAPLFMSRKSNRLSTRQVRRMIHVWQKRAGSENTLNFHALRHTACTAVYRNTKDIRLTQRFARHVALRSTGIYTHPTVDDLSLAVQNIPC